MSNNGTLNTLLKVAGVGLLVYAAYKVGQKSVQNENPIIDIPFEPVETKTENSEKTSDEEQYVQDLIKELSRKPNKTKKDIYNIELLQIKLAQLKNKK